MSLTREPETREEFRAQLERLIRTAESNGVDVAGGYGFRTDDDAPDWNVELSEVQKSSEPD